MCKRLLILVLLLGLVLALVACGGESAAPAEEEAAPAEGTGEDLSGAGEGKRVALIIAQGGLGDRSYNDSAFAGLTKAAQDFGVEVVPIESPDPVGEGEQLLRTAAEAGKNILDVGLNNGNPIAHPAPAMLNAGRVEYSHGEFYHYKEGITPHVAHVISAIDEERMALCTAMGYPAIPTVERMYLMGYGVSRKSLYDAYNTSPVFCGEYPIKGPYSVMDRYFVEDTMYGLVTWSSLGRAVGVGTPTIDAVVHVISTLHQKDYAAQGERSLETLGLSNLNADQLNLFFETGSLQG